MNIVKKAFLFTLTLLWSFSSFAQKEEHVFGQITQNEVGMSFYEKDEEAGAVVLFDQGKSSFIRSEYNSSAYIISFTRVRRIKIFDKSEYGRAQVEIPYYTDGYGKTEKVFNIEAASYNYEDGVLQKSELDPDNVFSEKTNDYWSKKKFAIPNVKEGSIIEYKYELNTPFRFNLPDWEFQSTIPTIYSEYEVRMIPFYEYVYLLQGIGRFDYQESYIDNMDRRFGNIDFQDYVHQYVLKDVQAFKDESYISSIGDYIVKMDFQMSKFHSQTGATTEIITTWPELNKSLLKHDKFGKYITGCKKIVEKNLVGVLDMEDKNPMQKSRVLIEYLKNNFSWNEKTGKYASQKPKEVFAKKSGNTAELNLLLVTLLQAQGLEAIPVLISTRDHGKIDANYPFEHFFNNVVVLIKFEKGYLLVDGSDPLTPYNYLPSNCLNGKGLLVEKESESWVSLSDNSRSLINEKLKLKISTDEETIQGEFIQESLGYDSRTKRNVYKDETGKIIADYASRGFSNIEEVKSINFENTLLPYVIGFKANYPVEIFGDIISIAPFLSFPMSENGLRQEERKYPVDMVYKKNRGYSSYIEIPEGYMVSSLPEKYNLNNELIKIEYEAKVEGTNVVVVGAIEYKKSVYAPSEYSDLKSHFSKIVKLFNEQIILKRN